MCLCLLRSTEFSLSVSRPLPRRCFLRLCQSVCVCAEVCCGSGCVRAHAWMLLWVWVYVYGFVHLDVYVCVCVCVCVYIYTCMCSYICICRQGVVLWEGSIHIHTCKHTWWNVSFWMERCIACCSYTIESFKHHLFISCSCTISPIDTAPSGKSARAITHMYLYTLCIHSFFFEFIYRYTLCIRSFFFPIYSSFEQYSVCLCVCLCVCVCIMEPSGKSARAITCMYIYRFVSNHSDF